MAKKSSKKPTTKAKQNTAAAGEAANEKKPESITTATSASSVHSVSSTNRRLKKPKYKSFKLEKRIRYRAPKTPSTIKIFRESLGIIKKNWKILLGISSIYGVLYLVLVRGIGGGLNFADLKEQVSTALNSLVKDGSVSSLTTVAGLVGLLLVNPAAGNQVNVAANFYQSVLFVVFIMALIWALRQIAAGQKITIKDSFYKGMYPLVPFVLVLIVIAIQAAPVLIGNTILQIVQDPESPIALSLAEQMLWAVFWFLMFVASVYMISGSVFALIVVTMANMTPMRALRGAYDLVRFRRLAVMRRLVLFVIVLLAGMIVVMLPVLLWVVKIASVVYVLWSVFSVTLMVTFLYTMYRRMLPRE